MLQLIIKKKNWMETLRDRILSRNQGSVGCSSGIPVAEICNNQLELMKQQSIIFYKRIID